MLPKLPNRDRIKKAQTLVFGGIDRNPGAVDGTLWYTQNMGSDRMPCLSPRKPRYLIGQYPKCNGMFSYDGMYLVNDTTIYKDGIPIGTAKNTEPKSFAAMNGQVIMFPDKLWIGESKVDEPRWTTGQYIAGVMVSFADNIVLLQENSVNWSDFGITAGDELTIIGSSAEQNNRTATVMEVSGNTLRLGGNAFTPQLGVKITIRKVIPDTAQAVHVEADIKSGYSETLDLTCDYIDAAGWRPDLGEQWEDMGFAAGDTVQISGSSIPGNNKTAVITMVKGAELAFISGMLTAVDDEVLTVTKVHQQPEEGLVHPLELTIEANDVIFEDQTKTVDGVSQIVAYGNTIKRLDAPWSGLEIGDTITITGSRESMNNSTFTIQDIDGHYLRSSEYSFANTPQVTPGATEKIVVTREIPDMDGIFVHENRLWGYLGNTIYISKLGDPSNFVSYNNLVNDAWTWEMDGTGDILGAIVYQGYPTFFKEDKVVRIYGDRPSQYRTMDVSAMGIHPGCGKSLAIAGDTLYYVSRNGLTSYRGGYSQNIHEPFGDMQFTQAVAGSDGRRYFLSAYDGNSRALYVYDTVWNCWFREDSSTVKFFSWERGNLYFYEGQYLWLDGHAARPPEGITKAAPVTSDVEFNDFTGTYWKTRRAYGNPSRKGTSKIQLRVTLEAGTELTVYMVFDDDRANSVKVATLKAEGKRSYYLPIIPRRSDHYRIYLHGVGDWTLNSLVREEYSGSDIH